MPHSSTIWHPSAPIIDQVIGWVRQSGHIALRHFTHTAPLFKADGTLVSQADLEIEEFLADKLGKTFPEHSLVAEEHQLGSIDLSRPIWTLDPLDGTTAFLQGLAGWGISIGMLHMGEPRFGLFYMPLINDLTYTSSEGSLYRNGHEVQRALRLDWNAKGFLAVGSRVHQDFDMDVPRIRTLGSIGASLVYTARGSAVAALVPKARLWDLAAGAAIMAGVGGELCYLSGRPISYMELMDGRRAREPIIAGHPDLLAELQSAIRPLDPGPELASSRD
jgi:fructose-1,6-bisphosphatase/inositol monophosphatase family enzyme